MWDIRWSEWSEEHIARHRVKASEVRQVLRNRPLLVRDGRVAKVEGEHRESTNVYGVTDADRHLFIVLSVDPNGTAAFVVTARPMTDRERREFRALTQEDAHE
jgi:uncharacterized DUF497 family protein